MIDLNDTTGNVVSINANQVAYISPAAEMSTKRPLLGYCAIVFTGGATVVVKGSREEVKEMIEHGEWKPPIDITRAA